MFFTRTCVNKNPTKRTKKCPAGERHVQIEHVIEKEI